MADKTVHRMTRLKEVLDDLNISQRDFADMIKVSKNSVNTWVKGKSNPTLDNLYKAAAVLGIDVTELMVKDNPYMSDKK